MTDGQRCCLLREAAKKVIFKARPQRGGGGCKGLATKKEKILVFAASLTISISGTGKGFGVPGQVLVLRGRPAQDRHSARVPGIAMGL